MRMAGERKRPSVVVRFSGGRGGGGLTKKDGYRLLNCDKSDFSMTSKLGDVPGPQRVKFHNIHIIPCSYHTQKISS